MANSAELKRTIPGSPFQEKLQKIYLDKSVLAHESERYLSAVDKFVELYGDGDLSIYSAPGPRSAETTRIISTAKCWRHL